MRLNPKLSTTLETQIPHGALGLPAATLTPEIARHRGAKPQLSCAKHSTWTARGLIPHRVDAGGAAETWAPA